MRQSGASKEDEEQNRAAVRGRGRAQVPPIDMEIMDPTPPIEEASPVNLTCLWQVCMR